MSINYITNFKKNFPIFFLAILPYSFIAGPAILEITCNCIGLYFLYTVIKNKKYFFFKNYFVYIFILFYLYIVTRSLFSFDPYFTLSSSLFYFRFLFYILGIWLILNTFDKAEKIFLINSFFAVLLVAIGLLIEYLYFSKFSSSYDPQYVRYFSLFIDEPIPGSYISRFLPYAILAIVIFFDNLNMKTFFYSLLITFFIFMVYISGERVAFFYSILCLLIFLFFISNSKFKIYLILLFTFIFLLINIYDSRVSGRMISFTNNQIFNAKIDKSFIMINDKNNKDNLDRKILIKRELEASNFPGYSPEHKRHFYSAYLMFQDNKLFGQGPKSFRKLCKNKLFFVPGACTTHPHNTILQLLAEIGLFGILFYLAIIGWIMTFFFQVFLKKLKGQALSQDYSLQLLYFCALLIAFFPFVPSGNFFNNWLSFAYFLPIGFILNRKLNLSDQIK